MGVLVVHIRRMRVGMRCRRMAVPMAVTACGHDRMRVDMVPVVVDVGMFMFQRLVAVLVSVVFGQMQCHTHKHQKATEHHQPSCSALSQAPRRQRHIDETLLPYYRHWQSPASTPGDQC